MSLEAENIQLKAEIQELKRDLLYATHELDRMKHMMFGHQSERSKSLYYVNDQLKLFGGEKPADQPQAKKVKVRSHNKVTPRKKPKRVIFPADLPREDQILNPEGIDEEQHQKIGEDNTEILAYKPGEIYVKRTIRPRWIPIEKEGSGEA